MLYLKHRLYMASLASRCGSSKVKYSASVTYLLMLVNRAAQVSLPVLAAKEAIEVAMTAEIAETTTAISAQVMQTRSVVVAVAQSASSCSTFR